MMRPELPYDVEVIPRADRIGFVCHTEWLKKELKITCIGPDNKKGQTILPALAKETVFRGLREGLNYEISISRNDLIGLKYRPRTLTVRTGNKPYVVLIGASVGYAWNLPSLPARTGRSDFVFGYRRGKEGFDKTDALVKLLDSELTPGAVILKECAAYFPRDTQGSMDMIERWVDMIRVRGPKPILATVVPVIPVGEQVRPGIQKSINEFNDRIREFGYDQGIVVLDLQNVLEDGSEFRSLRKEYALPDGLHLKEETYTRILDPLLLSLMTRIIPAAQR